MKLFVSTSKYEDALRKNNELLNEVNTSNEEIKILKAEILKLKEIHKAHLSEIQTLQNAIKVFQTDKQDFEKNIACLNFEVEGLKAENLELQNNVDRLEIENLELQNNAENAKMAAEHLIKSVPIQVLNEEIDLEIAIRIIEEYFIKNLPNMNAHQLKTLFDSIIYRKEIQSEENRKQKLYMSQILGILKYLLSYAHKEEKIIDLLAITDTPSIKDDFQEKINNIPLGDIICSEEILETYSENAGFEKSVYVKLIRVLRQLCETAYLP